MLSLKEYIFELIAVCFVNDYLRNALSVTHELGFHLL